jgi:flagellum-specific peptidoglycan hydrolase FlgJ
MHAHNFAGIKGSTPRGVSLFTREASAPGKLVRRTFRAYPNAEAGALDYVRLLSERYPSAFRAAKAGNLERFVFALGQGGYFTDSDRVYLRALALLSDEFKKRELARH